LAAATLIPDMKVVLASSFKPRGRNAGPHRGSSSFKGRSSHGRSGGGRSGGGKKGRFNKTFDVSQFINKSPVTKTETEVFEPKHKFTEFGLDKKLAFAITSAGMTNPTPIQDEIISTSVTLDYLGGSFDRNYFTDEELKYGNINFGIAPQYQLTQDDLTLNLGVNLVYLNDTQAGKNKFYVYPNITASYRLVDELLIAYGGLEGGLIQNSYENFAQENPFVSPTLFITPTDQQYNVHAGIKGKLSNSISYNVNARYLADRSKALYKVNSVLGEAIEDYQLGNSYNIVYDDVKTFSFSGELNVDVNRNFKLGVKAEALSIAKPFVFSRDYRRLY
jgi:hypothetical protein